jgi:hypothetical protein
MNGAMEKVIDGIVGVLEWIEAKKDDPADSTMWELSQECGSVSTIGRRQQRIKQIMDPTRQNISRALQN